MKLLAPILSLLFFIQLCAGDQPKEVEGRPTLQPIYQFVVFHSYGCPHCHDLLYPGGKWDFVCEKLQKFKESISCQKMEVNHNRAFAEAHGVKNVPTIMMFKPDGTSSQYVGLRSADDLLLFVKYHTGLEVDDDVAISARMLGTPLRWLMHAFEFAEEFTGQHRSHAATLSLVVAMAVGIICVGGLVVFTVVFIVMEWMLKKEKLKKEVESALERAKEEKEQEERLLRRRAAAKSQE